MQIVRQKDLREENFFDAKKRYLSSLLASEVPPQGLSLDKDAFVSLMRRSNIGYVMKEIVQDLLFALPHSRQG